MLLFLLSKRPSGSSTGVVPGTKKSFQEVSIRALIPCRLRDICFWGARDRSIIQLQLGPNFLQIEPGSAAEPDGVVFVATRIWMLHASDGLHRRKMIAIPSPVALQDDHDLAGVVARSPQPIAVVLADG